MPIDPLLQGLIAGFVEESRELGQKITRDLLSLERASAAAELSSGLESAARGMHTLKGSAATLGLQDLAELAHKMEDVLAPVRKAPRKVPAEIVDALLAALDSFQLRLKAHHDGAALPDLVASLQQLAAVLPGEEKAEAAPAPAAAPAGAEALAAEAASDGSWRVGSRQVGALMSEVERLRELCLRLEERRREVGSALAQVKKAVALVEGDADSEQMRLRLARAERGLQGDSEDALDIVAGLEESLKEICTLPVRTILEPLQRSLRDLCRQTGKEAGLSFVGAEVGLDRSLLESLKGSLVQLLRNAVDHGLEPPDERERKGKHREGALVIRVEQVGNLVFIEVSDDGRGLDTERIRQVAIQRGLLGPEELEKAGPAQLHQLIFRSGFSTREEVTETSGRGVGLDVVREHLLRQRGQVEVQSVAGQGTRFVLTIPAQLGSSPLVLVKVSGQRLALPAMSVQGIVAAKGDRLRGRRGRHQFEYEGQLLPLRDLGALLGLRQATAPEEGQPLLILRAKGELFALAADEVQGERELVVRSLPEDLKKLGAYQGVATLAHGGLVLVVRSDWLGGGAQAEVAEAERKALVVDDSLTARALHRTVLESGGWTVHTAAGAAEALEQLKRCRYDVVICDVVMQPMDGFSLTSLLRSRPETAQTPVVLVSSRDAVSDRDRGQDAGADGFLSKRDCASGRLLTEVAAALERRRGRA